VTELYGSRSAQTTSCVRVFFPTREKHCQTIRLLSLLVPSLVWLGLYLHSQPERDNDHEHYQTFT